MATTFVQDTFTGVDLTNLDAHVGETGATWTKHSSSGTSTALLTDANRCRQSSSGTDSAVYLASGVPPRTEYDVEGQIFVASVLGQTGIAGRFDEASNTGYEARYASNSGQWELRKIVNGIVTFLDTFPEALTPGLAYALKLEIRDATKKLFVNGVERCFVTDNEITAAGKAGLRLSGNPSHTSGLHLDSLTAVDPAAAPPVPVPITNPQTKGFETGDLSEFANLSTSLGTIVASQEQAYRGSP